MILVCVAQIEREPSPARRDVARPFSRGGGIDLKCADKIPKLPTNIEKMTTKKNYFVINLNGLCVYVSVCMCVRLCLTFSVSAKSSYTFEARVTTDASKYFLGLRQGSLSIWF